MTNAEYERQQAAIATREHVQYDPAFVLDAVASFAAGPEPIAPIPNREDDSQFEDAADRFAALAEAANDSMNPGNFDVPVECPNSRFNGQHAYAMCHGSLNDPHIPHGACAICHKEA